MTDILLSCWIGQTVRLDATFRDADTSALIDVMPVTFTLEDPHGAPSAYVLGTNAELQHISTGLYRLTVTLSVAGTWSARAVGGNPVVAVIEGQVVVHASELG